MQNTVNLNLKKPDQNDFVNIGDINDNMDILDAEVAKKYVKPLAGIPSLDLDSATQAALKKAETALQTVTKSSVGLGNVDNTSDVNKPVSTAQQVALNKKANLASPSLTGTPTAPTAAESTNTQQIATTAFVKTAVDKSATTINDSIATHQADLVSHGIYGVATGTNALVMTDSKVTSYVDGMLVAFKNTTASTASTTLNINSLGAKAIVKANGTAVNNLKANAIYQLRYNGTNFILLGEGGEYGNVTASDVLSGKIFGTENGLQTGNLTIASLGGKRFATGVSSVTENLKTFQLQYNQGLSPYIEVKNINFKPSFILIISFYKPKSGPAFTLQVIYKLLSDGLFEDSFTILKTGTPNVGEPMVGLANRLDGYVNDTGFLLPVPYESKTYTWYAYE